MTYQAGLWWAARGKACACLGVLTSWLPPEPQPFLRGIILWMLAGATWFLIKPKVSTLWGSLDQRPKQFLKVSAFALCLAATVPAIQVGYVGWVNPTTTAPLVIRSVDAKFHGKSVKPIEMRWMCLDDIPRTVVESVVLAEDRQFWEHSGFNWQQIRLAMVEAETLGTPTRGASTISQQCARSLFLWHGRSWVRKGLEAYYTFWMESLLSKHRILELYLNSIETGDGVYGIEAGARHHFGVSTKDLNQEEAAMLATVLPSPKKWDPHNPNETMAHRQAAILKELAPVSVPASRKQVQ